MSPKQMNLLQALANEARHGYGVAEWIQRTTDGTLEVEDGALYTALHRMQKRGWLERCWSLRPWQDRFPPGEPPESIPGRPSRRSEEGALARSGRHALHQEAGEQLVEVAGRVPPLADPVGAVGIRHHREGLVQLDETVD